MILFLHTLHWLSRDTHFLTDRMLATIAVVMYMWCCLST